MWGGGMGDGGDGEGGATSITTILFLFVLCSPFILQFGHHCLKANTPGFYSFFFKPVTLRLNELVTGF